MSPQRTIAHYRITSKLGEGGMGEVWRATDTRLHRDVAIKILPERFAGDTQRMTRLSREAQVLASLNHPNIAAIYGVEEHAIVMEFVEGKTLAERIAAGRLPLDAALAIAMQIAAALEAAHSRGIIHRDLKPANIKILPDGRCKVLDFGLAKVSRGGESEVSDSTQTLSMTQEGAILGTPSYMAPEQARGDPVDKRADIWAFGAVLYEMLTGERPFRGRTSSDVMAAVLSQEIDWTAVPARTRRLLRSCLERDPGRRLRDAGDIGLLLEDPPEPAASRSGGVRIAIAALGVAAMVLAVLLWRATRNHSQPQGLLRFDADLGPDAVDNSGEGSVVVLSPDGTRFAYMVRPPGRPIQIATRLLDQAAPVLLQGTEGTHAPFFSPDGQWIGFFAGGKLKKVPVRGGPVVTLCNIVQSRGAWWGADGYIITNLSAGSGLYRVPEAGGDPQRLTAPEATGEATHRWPQLLPGGQAVLFTGHTITANYDEANLEVLSLKSGKWGVVQRGGYFGRYVPTGHILYVNQSALYAVPFDLDRLRVRGAPVPLLDDVDGNRNNGNGRFDVRNGMLVYVSNRNLPARWPVAWIDQTGRLETIPLDPGEYSAPRISPDGGRLALAAAQSGGGSDIEVYDFQRQTTMRLTFTHNNTRPVWTPDGKHIVFTTESARSIALRWMRADGTGGSTTLMEDKNEIDPWSFSPDGRLAFAWLAADSSYHLWTLPLDLHDPDQPKASQPQPFLRSSFQEMQPAFSPDGRWIAYVSAQPGASGIYVSGFSPAGGGDPPKWQISPGGSSPVWSRNGHELFYQGDGKMMVVSYTEGKDSFTADKPRPWSSRPAPAIRNDCCDTWYVDLSPDAQRFIVFPMPELARGPGRSVHAEVLLNFLDYLRQRVPVSK